MKDFFFGLHSMSFDFSEAQSYTKWCSKNTPKDRGPQDVKNLMSHRALWFFYFVFISHLDSYSGQWQLLSGTKGTWNINLIYRGIGILTLSHNIKYLTPPLYTASWHCSDMQELLHLDNYLATPDADLLKNKTKGFEPWSINFYCETHQLYHVCKRTCVPFLLPRFNGDIRMSYINA